MSDHTIMQKLSMPGQQTFAWGQVERLEKAVRVLERIAEGDSTNAQREAADVLELLQR